MTTRLAGDFMQTLQETERSRDVGPLMALFADDAEAQNLGRTEPARGRMEVRQFWEHYLEAFHQIRSEFTRVLESDEGVVLEWISRGTLTDGRSIDYRGISILEPAAGPVARFRTYYDSAVFLSVGESAKSGQLT